MDKIYANTDAIQEVAQNIASYNNSIQNQYSIVNTAISKIKNYRYTIKLYLKIAPFYFKALLKNLLCLK